MLGKAKAVCNIGLRLGLQGKCVCPKSVVFIKESGFFSVILCAFPVFGAFIVFFLCAALYPLLVGSAEALPPFQYLFLFGFFCGGQLPQWIYSLPQQSAQNNKPLNGWT